MKYLIILILLISNLNLAEDRIKIGIDEQLGKQIPLDITYKDEQGNPVLLKDLMGKPTVFTFVYYDCPGICTPLLNSLAKVVEVSDLKPGVDYNIISLSFDDTDTPELATRKKHNYLDMIEKEFPSEAWRFLTGDSTEIRQLTDAAGFYFQRDGKEFIHSGAFIFVTGDGKITRYLFPGYSEKGGFSILPFDFKMAVTETQEGKVTPTIARFLQFCFSYDPEGKTYVFNITRVLGAGMIVLVIGFVLFLTIKPKKAQVKRGSEYDK
jgi:protein SCO1